MGSIRFIKEPPRLELVGAKPHALESVGFKEAEHSNTATIFSDGEIQLGIATTTLPAEVVFKLLGAYAEYEYERVNGKTTVVYDL